MNRRCLVAAALLIATAGPLQAQSVKAGIEAWQRSDYAGAVSIWRPLADKGDADAEFNLGQAYRLGRGVPTNLAASKTWFERAATQGHLDAETTLGLLLFQNNEQADGLKWLKKAAERGEPRALLVYGTALVNGDSVTQDPVLGYAYVSRAAAQGLAPAKETLTQLDQILPIADRKRGVQIASEMAKEVPAPAPAADEAPRPVKTAKAEVPPKPQKMAKAKPPAQPPAQAQAKPTEKLALAKAPPQRPVKPAATVSERPAKPVATASASAAKGDWRIQLGAFSQRGNAEAQFKKVSGKSALAGRHPYYVSAGPVTRLQVGPFESKSAADSACKAVGVSCFPVSAK
ncbi:MAG TPA: SPOR domain-containing protein [Sphingomicrobium sp.]|nr:SPOR domain-containing protein [Sphingomicrobium sp.]